jgi:Response regulators consisting of a CheY-like receiver domain and a winged-helix DNA-binding domain
MKILLVEDEPKLNEFVQKGLEQHGYVVDSVSNGTAALDLAHHNRMTSSFSI